jgi:hypothetical protein
MNYDKILNTEINLEISGLVINKLKLTSVKRTEHISLNRGMMYLCKVDWYDKEIDGSYPQMEIDEHTLDELLHKKVSYNPDIHTACMRIV